MRKRVEQPPVNPRLRDPERHDFWPAFILVIVAGALLLCGGWHVTGVETSEGGGAREIQLIKAFAKGGLQVVDSISVPDPALFQDPAAAAEALERMAREEAKGLRIKYRVNTGAADPCPT